MFNQKLLFKCKTCGKEGRAQRLSEIRANGNFCSHECHNKYVYVSPEEKKRRRREYMRIYARRPEVRVKLYASSERWRQKKVAVNRLARQQRNEAKLQALLLQRKLKEERIKARTCICKQCNATFVADKPSRQFCSAKCNGASRKKYTTRPKRRGIRKELFEKIKARYNYQCAICGGKEPFDQYWKYLVQDHIHPVSKGGRKRCQDNIQPLCWDCNLKKSDKFSDVVV